MTRSRVSVVVINIPHRMRRETAREHRRRARYDSRLAMRLGDVVLACEIDRGNDGPFEGAAARYGKRVAFRARKTQVAFPAGWGGFIRLRRTLTDALAGVNPARDLNGVMVPDERTIYWSAHLPNGKDKPGKTARLWRAYQWRRYERRAGRKLARWHARGWRQVVGGDINDRDGLNLEGLPVVTARRAGLMHLYAIPAPGGSVEVSRARTVRSNKGDHPVVRATLTFKE